MIGISVAVISLIFGIIFGTISGFYGKFVGRLIMGIVDILLAFPSLLLAIGMVAILGAGAIPVICAITTSRCTPFYSSSAFPRDQLEITYLYRCS